jgi:hypothetical protein
MARRGLHGWPSGGGCGVIRPEPVTLDVSVFGGEPVVPDYQGGCISNVVPALLDGTAPSWMPADARQADQVVLLVLDGLGWDQLQARLHLAPALAAMTGDAITTIAPSTTATALTSITIGLPPGEHGVVGYRIWADHQVLNILRWTVPAGDGRRRFPPQEIQPHEAFLGHRPPVVTRAEFADTGFTHAHLEGSRFTGYRQVSTLVTHVVELARRGEPFIYAYYEGIDKVAHEYGLGAFYDAELVNADRLVADLLAALPAGVTLLVTADHGQVETGTAVIHPHEAVLACTTAQSGEARFRWFHARPGRVRGLYDACLEHHGGEAWVFGVEELVDGGWFGPKVTDAARGRLGDVALLARGTAAFHDPADSGPYVLVGRHGSLTRAEMLVPLVAAVATG